MSLRLLQVLVGDKAYKASHSAPTKKLAKATAAAACLVALGIVADSGHNPLATVTPTAPAPPQQGNYSGHQQNNNSNNNNNNHQRFNPGNTQHQQQRLPTPDQSMNHPPQGQMNSHFHIGMNGGHQNMHPLMSINACDYSGRNSNVNIIIGPQIPPTHSSYNFALQDLSKEMANPNVGAFPPPGLELNSFPPPGPAGDILPPPPPPPPPPEEVKKENKS